MPTASPPFDLATLNAMDRDAFVAALGGLFEGPPWIVAEAWSARPFADLDALHRALCAVMFSAPEERKVELLRALVVERRDGTWRLPAASTPRPSACSAESAIA